MSSNDFASLLYLTLLGTVIGGYFLVSQRRNMGQVARQAALWGLIFVGAVAAAGLWQDIRSTVPGHAMVSETGQISVPRAPDGHYYLTLEVDGTPVRFIVDTGASDMVLSLDDARRIGLVTNDLRFTGRARTANGEVSTAPVWLDEVALGPVVHRDVSARVSQGEMPGSLLGMGYLSRFASLSIENGRLTLTP